MTKSSAKSVVDTGHDSVGGIVAMCLAMVCFIVSDVFSKLAAETLAVGEVILLRGLMTTALFAVPATGASGTRVFRAMGGPEGRMFTTKTVSNNLEGQVWIDQSLIEKAP